MIRLIIFDAGGVLYSGSQETVSRAVRGFLARHCVHDFDKSKKLWSEIARLVSLEKSA
jgi:FMN phosphatase YigB (HAD superfamily)